MSQEVTPRSTGPTTGYYLSSWPVIDLPAVSLTGGSPPAGNGWRREGSCFDAGHKVVKTLEIVARGPLDLYDRKL